MSKLAIRDMFLRFPGGKRKALTLSYDDAVCEDERFIGILDKNEIKCTFNINSGLFSDEEKYVYHKRLTENQVLRLYDCSKHEVAIHGYTHPHLERLPDVAVVNEIMNDRKKLESMFGIIVRGMAYPYGTMSDEVVEILKKCGIVYARTIKSSSSLELPTDWLRLRPTCHHDSENTFDILDEFLNNDDNPKPQMFYMWGHSYEFDGNNNWERIEDFAKKAGGHDDVWYATNIEIYNYISAYKSLIFGADMTMVFNPTSTDVCFEYSNRVYVVNAGKTVILA